MKNTYKKVSKRLVMTQRSAYWDVVSDQIPVTKRGCQQMRAQAFRLLLTLPACRTSLRNHVRLVQYPVLIIRFLMMKQSRVTYSASAGALNCTKANKDWSAPRRVAEHAGGRVLRQLVVEDPKGPMGACTSSMHNTLRNALMVKPVDLLASDVVLKQRRPSGRPVRRLEPCIGIADSRAPVRRDALRLLNVGHITREISLLGIVGAQGGHSALNFSSERSHDGRKSKSCHSPVEGS